MRTYTPHLRRDDNGTWVAEAHDQRGKVVAATFGRTIRSARANLTESLALLLDVEPTDLDVAPPTFDLGDLSELAAEVASRRSELRQAEQDHMAATRSIARRLVRELGLSTRDVAEVLDYSHQRVQQLLLPGPGLDLDPGLREAVRFRVGSEGRGRR